MDAMLFAMLPCVIVLVVAAAGFIRNSHKDYL